MDLKRFVNVTSYALVNSSISAAADLVFLYGSHFVHKGLSCWNRKKDAILQ